MTVEFVHRMPRVVSNGWQQGKSPMIGIALSADQIRSAPPEVRAWLEQQIANEFGFRGFSRSAPELPSHVVGCDVEVVKAVLAAIQRALPVVNVFFDLAHEPSGKLPQGLRVLRLEDIARRCRLASVGQVVACLGTIDAALRKVTGQQEVTMTAVDESGHCLVPEPTAHAIFTVWQDMVGAPEESPLGIRAGVAGQGSRDAA